MYKAHFHACFHLRLTVIATHFLHTGKLKCKGLKAFDKHAASYLLANRYINPCLLSPRCFVLLSHRCFPPKDKMNIPTVTHLEFLNPLHR